MTIKQQLLIKEVITMTIYKHKNFDSVLPYTYWIRHKTTNKKYHGVRWANVRLKKSPRDDIGVVYFTSGKLSKDFKENTKDYEIFLSWTFDNKYDALDWEYRVNVKLLLKEDWVNKGAGKNIVQSEEGKLRMIDDINKRWDDYSYRENISVKMKSVWADDSYKKRLSESHKERYRKNPDLVNQIKKVRKEKGIGFKDYRFVHRDGSQVIVKSYIVKWCKDNGLSYHIMRKNLNTDDYLKWIDCFGRVVKESDWKCFSNESSTYTKSKKRSIKYFVHRDGRIIKTDSITITDMLKEIGISYGLFTKFLDSYKYIRKTNKENKISIIYDWKVFTTL